ncbi:MAG: ATP-dependent zinc metalloprotease FtsH [Planctomycetota bacterium]|nr:ATP-dependent zinc metalloprotease FtsH [Planctomycetota bacterium]
MNNNASRFPGIYSIFLVLMAVMFLNSMLVPALSKQQVTEVDYGTFLTQLQDGEITDVTLENGKINYAAKDTKGKTALHVTGAWDDAELVDRLHAKNVKFTRVIPHENSPIINFLLNWILPLAIFMLLGQFFARQLQKNFGGKNALTLGKSNAKIYAESETGKTFSDVAGQDEAKEALREIVDFLHSPQKYAAIGAALPKGALLMGPPGTGKTLLAKAVAGEAHVPFFSISGSEFVEMFVGMGAAKVRDLFKQADAKAPCIIFIDEIDTIGKRRDVPGAIGGNDEREQTLNQLLSEMDGFDGRGGVVILGATNRPDSLDPALLRPGRFDRRIPVELPDLAGREAILRVHAGKVRMDGGADFGLVARATAGASGAELENIINEAALRAIREGRDAVKQCDLEESVEVVIAGYQRKSAVISPEEKRMISYHEIGHALVAAKLSDSTPVHKITIIPRTSGALGYTMQVDEGERFLMTREQILTRIATFAGGRAAEEAVFNTMTSGASNDIEQMTKLARAMVARFGMSGEIGMVTLETVENRYLGGDASLAASSATGAKLDAQVAEITRGCHQRALGIIRGNMETLHKLAGYLLEKETVSGEEFMAMLNGGEGKPAAVPATSAQGLGAK